MSQTDPKEQTTFGPMYILVSRRTLGRDDRRGWGGGGEGAVWWYWLVVVTVWCNRLVVVMVWWYWLVVVAVWW